VNEIDKRQSILLHEIVADSLFELEESGVIQKTGRTWTVMVRKEEALRVITEPTLRSFFL